MIKVPLVMSSVPENPVIAVDCPLPYTEQLSWLLLRELSLFAEAGYVFEQADSVDAEKYYENIFKRLTGIASAVVSASSSSDGSRSLLPVVASLPAWILGLVRYVPGFVSFVSKSLSPFWVQIALEVGFRVLEAWLAGRGETSNDLLQKLEDLFGEDSPFINRVCVLLNEVALTGELRKSEFSRLLAELSVEQNELLTDLMQKFLITISRDGSSFTMGWGKVAAQKDVGERKIN